MMELYLNRFCLSRNLNSIILKKVKRKREIMNFAQKSEYSNYWNNPAFVSPSATEVV
jgi:hypothetical protein